MPVNRLPSAASGFASELAVGAFAGEPVLGMVIAASIGIVATTVGT